MGFPDLSLEIQQGLQKLAKPLTILFVDDDLSYSEKFVAQVLRPLGFANIICANNGKEALSLFKQNQCDIIITDFDMPQKCGTDLVRECAELNLADNKPVIAAIIISKYDDATAIQELLFGVQVQYIAKNKVYQILNFSPIKGGVCGPIDQKDEEKIWINIFHSMQWAADIKKVNGKIKRPQLSAKGNSSVNPYNQKIQPAFWKMWQRNNSRSV